MLNFGHFHPEDFFEEDVPVASLSDQSLFAEQQGHPPLIMLTAEIITEELKVFVRLHFKDTVNQGNRSLLKMAWDKFIAGDEPTDEDLATLRILDISPEKQAAFITSLTEKYDHQFTDKPAFLSQIKAAFVAGATQNAHAINFRHFHPEEFFKEDVPVANLSDQGLFAEQQGPANNKPMKKPPGPDKK